MSKAVELNPTVDFIAGVISGIAGLVVGFPFDTVKVRFQNPSLAGRYHSTLHAITSIVSGENLAGLYKGISSPLATVALTNGLLFASYRFLTKIQLANSDSVPTISQVALAGAGTGIVCSIINSPVELIKIRQQSLLTKTTARQVALQIFRENGISGLYRGVTATALRDIGYGPYFAVYEATSRYFASPPSATGLITRAEPKAGWFTMLLAGGIAGVVGWLCTFPMDVVKTRIQGSHAIYSPVLEALPLDGESANSLLGNRPVPRHDENPYKTTWSTTVHTYRTEGIPGFFRGLAPTLIRAIPVNAVTFAAFEAVVYLLN